MKGSHIKIRKKLFPKQGNAAQGQVVQQEHLSYSRHSKIRPGLAGPSSTVTNSTGGLEPVTPRGPSQAVTETTQESSKKRDYRILIKGKPPKYRNKAKYWNPNAKRAILQIRKHMHSSKPHCNLGLFTALYILHGAKNPHLFFLSSHPLRNQINLLYHSKSLQTDKVFTEVTHIICHLHFKN